MILPQKKKSAKTITVARLSRTFSDKVAGIFLKILPFNKWHVKQHFQGPFIAIGSS
jgi:hypothetical protein